MQRISSAKGMVIPFPRPKTESRRLVWEQLKRLNQAKLDEMFTIVNRKDEK